VKARWGGLHCPHMVAKLHCLGTLSLHCKTPGLCGVTSPSRIFLFFSRFLLGRVFLLGRRDVAFLPLLPSRKEQTPLPKMAWWRRFPRFLFGLKFLFVPGESCCRPSRLLNSRLQGARFFVGVIQLPHLVDPFLAYQQGFILLVGVRTDSVYLVFPQFRYAWTSCPWCFLARPSIGKIPLSPVQSPSDQ